MVTSNGFWLLEASSGLSTYIPHIMDNTRGLLSATKLYGYRPLETADEVRLITILTGQFENDLQIEIHHALLQLPDAVPTLRLPINYL